MQSPRISKETFELWMAKGTVKAHHKPAANTLAVATLTAPGDGQRLRLMKVDASYSTSATSGLLTVKSGTTVIFEKYIHGSGAFDFAELSGVPAEALNEAMSAELAAGGAGIIGTVSVTGFKHPEASS